MGQATDFCAVIPCNYMGDIMLIGMNIDKNTNIHTLCTLPHSVHSPTEMQTCTETNWVDLQLTDKVQLKLQYYFTPDFSGSENERVPRVGTG